MSTSSVTHPSPQQLLALDLAALQESPTGDWRRLGDRLAASRRGTVVVYLGGASFRDLPEPDYVIDTHGETILRLPAMERVEEWPVNGRPAGVIQALWYLAEGLLIPPSEVYCVFGPDRPTPVRFDRLIVVGGDSQPPAGTWARSADANGLINALDEALFFGRSSEAAPSVADTAFEAAVDSLRRNVHAEGFTAASVTDNPLDAYNANYAAVWARDGIITGLWTLCLDDSEFTDTFRNTIRCLARHQTSAGQIPANVRVASDQPDYSGIGGIASIDSVLWFVIGAVRLAFHNRDREFAEEVAEPVMRAMQWLTAHDANNDGLIEIPESSDWMDLFPRSYNVLYDEVLWWQACIDTAALLDGLGRDGGAAWRHQADRIGNILLDDFWPTGDQLMEIAGTQSGRFSPGEAYYLLSQITPFDYGWRCDVYANLLAALSGLLDDRKQERLFSFLWGVGVNNPFPVRCLYPAITSGADDWKDYFLVNFLNLPDHYHNGGAWPFIGGLWVRYIAATGRVELAHRELANLAEACRQGVGGEWEFNEWLHGTTGRPMGKVHQAWSAASFVHAYSVLHRDADPAAFPALDIAAISATPSSGESEAGAGL